MPILRDLVFLSLHPGKECDFYLNGMMYQVSYDIEEDKTRKRELEGLKFFADKLGKKKGVLVTYDVNEVLEYKGVGLEVVGLDEFLIKCKI